MSHDKYHAEPYFKFWRLTALENYGATDVRIDGVGLYGRDGGPELTQYAVGAEYSGGFAPDDLNAPVVNLPSVTIEFLYPIAARHMDLQYTATPGGQLFTNVWQGFPFVPSMRQWMYVEELALFVMVGTSGLIATSPDGKVWTVRTSPAANTWCSIAWSASLNRLVIIAEGGGAIRSAYSSDGITWTLGNLPNTHTWRAVTWSPTANIFVAVKSNVGNQYARSTDGISWTVAAATGFAVHFRASCILWSSRLGRFVMAGPDGIGVSPDGINWTQNVILNPRNFTRIAESETALVIVGANAPTQAILMHSTDAVTWTPSAVGATQLSDVTYSPALGLFMAMVNAGSTMWQSTDGATWSTVALPFPDSLYVTFSDTLARVVVFDSSGTNRINTSDNTVLPGGIEDAPRTVRIDVSNDNREFFELETLRDLQW